MDQVQRLIDAYTEGDLSAEDQAELSAWLQASPSNIDRFVRDSFLHWQLFAILGQRQLHAGVTAAPPLLAADVLQPASAVRAASRGALPQRAARSLHSFAALAATLVLLAVGAATYLALWPHTIAQLTKTSAGIAWQDPAAAPLVGALLHEGQTLRVAQGRALATLVSGARLIVEGPAEIRFDGDNSVWLQSGRIGVDVPAQATGLVIDSPFGQFVDMGTEFTINLDPRTGCQVHVFTGMIEMRTLENAGRPVVVSLGSAVTYDADSGDVSFLPYDKEQKLSL